MSTASMNRSPALAIAAEVFTAIPSLRVVVALAEGIQARNVGAIDSRWAEAWRSVHGAFGHPNPQSHPHVRDWRLAMRAAGASHKKFPTSVESLVRRALRSPEPFRVHPLVDFYNSVSLVHVVPAGAYDLDALPAPLELRPTRAGDTFEALDGTAPESVPAGELAYAAGSSIVTRQLVWRQSRLGLVGPQTRRALFVSEILPTHAELALDVKNSLVRGLQDLFGAEVRAAILSVDSPDLGSAARHAPDA